MTKFHEKKIKLRIKGISVHFKYSKKYIDFDCVAGGQKHYKSNFNT